MCSKTFFIFSLLVAMFPIKGLRVHERVAPKSTRLIYTDNYVFLPSTSDVARIKIKSNGQANIALTSNPFSDPPMYQFQLNAEGDKSNFMVNGVNTAQFIIPNMKSTNKFVEIILYWGSKSGYLIMAQIGDPIPTFHCKNESRTLGTIKYLGISAGIIRRVDSYCGCGNQDIFVRGSGINHWEIDFSSPVDFASYFNSTINPLLNFTSTESSLPNFSDESITIDSLEEPFQLG